MNTVLLAILNTLWQSVAIAAAVWVLLKLARGTNAATRHAVWWATLAIIVMLPFVARAGRRRPRRSLMARQVFHSLTRAAEAPLEIAAPSAAARTSGIELPRRQLDCGDLRALGARMFAATGTHRLELSVSAHAEARCDAAPPRRCAAISTPGCMSCGVRRPVRLLISTKVASPMAVGFAIPP